MRKLLQLILFLVLAYSAYKAITFTGDIRIYVYAGGASAVFSILLALFPSRKKKLRPLRRKYKITHV